MSEKIVTVITPTTGKDSLFKLIDSLEAQEIPHTHIILWDKKRDSDIDPFELEKDTEKRTVNCIVIRDNFVQGKAAGSALRAIGLMAAGTPYVTFADDDVWFEENHLKTLCYAIKGKNWAFSFRNIYSKEGVRFGVDFFESVADSPTRCVPYEMIDNNSMMFKREFGSTAAVLYRETKAYNDDRLMYGFLKQNAGELGKTHKATVNQICPDHLEEQFRVSCSK